MSDVMTDREAAQHWFHCWQQSEAERFIGYQLARKLAEALRNVPIHADYSWAEPTRTKALIEYQMVLDSKIYDPIIQDIFFTRLPEENKD